MEAQEDSRRQANCARLGSTLQEICPQQVISRDVELVREPGVDSAATLNFILRVEDAFGLVIGGKEIEDNGLLNLSSLLEFIELRNLHSQPDISQ